MKRRFGSYFYKSQSPANDMPYARSSGGSLIGRILKVVCISIGAVVLFGITMGILASFIIGGAPDLPKDMILSLDITDPVVEVENAPTLMNPTARSGMTVRQITELLDHAAQDKRVHGIAVKLSDAQMELAHIQEIRAAVKRFRAQMKTAYIYTASFGDLGSGIGAYYLASAFDQIWMQPTGFVAMTGISAEMPFARKVLDKVGAKPEFLHREEYKSAMESFTNEKMSPANREMMESIIGDLSGQILKDIATDRSLTPEQVMAQLDKGLIMGQEAMDAGLINGIGSVDEMTSLNEQTRKFSKRDDPEKEMVDAYDYYDSEIGYDVEPKGADVALVTISGEIIPGSDYETGYATGDYIAEAIKDAADNDNIKVIVVRVDSPGGSPSASETIRAAIVNAKAKDKKVVVSMGPVAASGGYWLAVDADKIFALPSTLTGSIGVIMGKFELSGLWEKIGVNWDDVSWGKNAQLWSMNKPMTEAHRVVLDAAIDDTYNSFLERVATGRKMDKVKVRSLAKGRAWTGAQAKENGLVDEIGGLDETLDYVATLVDAKDRTKLNIIVLPEPMSTFDVIMDLLGARVSIAQNLETQLPPSLMKSVAPVLKRAQVMERMGPIQVYDPRLSTLRY